MYRKLASVGSLSSSAWNRTCIDSSITVRTKRVKEARDEAKSEIADYKTKKEEEFKKFEAEVR